MLKHLKRVVSNVNYLCYALSTEEIVISKVKKVTWKVLKNDCGWYDTWKYPPNRDTLDTESMNAINSAETITMIRQHKK